MTFAVLPVPPEGPAYAPPAPPVPFEDAAAFQDAVDGTPSREGMKQPP